jgi:hypothetical protein
VSSSNRATEVNGRRLVELGESVESGTPVELGESVKPDDPVDPGNLVESGTPVELGALSRGTLRHTTIIMNNSIGCTTMPQQLPLGAKPSRVTAVGVRGIVGV